MSDINQDFSKRDPETDVIELISQRWSPRSFSSAPVSEDQLRTVIDAARWAPSCYNAQPWGFITSTSSTHSKFVSLLVEPNQVWAKTAPVLGFVTSERKFLHNGEDNQHANFDTGAACFALSLQAKSMGLHTHFMAGIHYDAIYEAFNLDRDRVQVICGFALGVIGDPQALPEKLRVMEAPSPRKSLSEVWESID